MARFDNPSNSKLKTHIVGSGENITVGSEHSGTMFIFNGDSNNTLYIGDYTDGHYVAIGTVITICTAPGGSCYLDVSNADIWGAGFNDTSNYWFFPSNTIGTLVKIDDANIWMISGASLGID
jgi:hypothetical protein